MTARNGFTLTELLVVISVIVLMLAGAMPLFDVLRGSRSLEAAENTVSAVLSRAREEAMILQAGQGVLFYEDPVNERVAMAMVGPAPRAADTRYLEMRHDSEITHLPIGIGAQFVRNYTVDGSGQKTSDEYLSFGLIMFDGQGQMVYRRYAIEKDTQLGRELPWSTHLDPPDSNPLYSQFGLILFDRPAFRNQAFATVEDTSFPLADPNIATASISAEEAQEEEWLHQHGVPLLVNRFNGTLIRGE